MTFHVFESREPRKARPAPDTSTADLFVEAVSEAVAEIPGATFDGFCIILPEEPLQRWRPSDRLSHAELEEGLLLNHRASSGPWKANRGAVEDWLLATMGDDDNGKVYLTTDHVHASEMNGASALDDAEFIAWARNNIGRALRELERLYAKEMGASPQTNGSTGP